MIATGADYKKASEVLDEAGGHVKTAIDMIRGGVSATEGRSRIEKAGGFVRSAIGAGGQ